MGVSIIFVRFRSNNVYTLALYLYYFGMQLASTWNPKASEWLKGRNGLMEDLLQWRTEHAKSSRLVWFHCASVGEYEQARSTISAFKKKDKGIKVVVTFFSPSGKFQVRTSDLVDYITYLPKDLPRRAKKFITILNPDVAIFVKNEFWVNHLRNLLSKNIPTYFLCTKLRKKSHIFYPGMKPVIQGISHIFCQDNATKEQFKLHGLDQVTTIGDTRVDRVLEIKNSPYDKPPWISENKPIIVYGSVWMEDIKVLAEFINGHNDYEHIILPHDISEENCKRIKGELVDDKHVKLIDKMGILNRLYRYACLVYIGGGFGQGVHNTLEAAVYGKPLIIGPNYKSFPEAIAFIDYGFAKSISKSDDVAPAVEHQINNKNKSKRFAENYFKASAGATKKVKQILMEDGVL